MKSGKELVKKAKHETENCKVSIRNSRKIGNDEIKQHEKAGLAEDVSKNATDKVQELTDFFIKKTDDHLARKEKEIMTI